MEKTTIVKRVGSGTFWGSFGNVIVKATGLVTLFFILRTLTLYEYGVVELVLSVISALSIFLLTGLQGVVVADMGVEAGKGDWRRFKTIFLNYWQLQLALGVFAWGLVFFGAGLIAQFYNAHIAYLIRIVSFIFLLGALKVPLYTIFPVHFRFFEQSLYNFLEELFKLCFILFFFYVQHKGVEGVLYSIVLSQVVAALLMAPSFLSIYRPLRQYEATREPLWELLRHHGKWSVLSTYLGTLGQNARIWFVKLFLGTEAVGLFAAAQGIVAQLTSFAPLPSVVNPILARFAGDLPRFGRIMTSAVKYQLLIFIVVAAGAVLLLPPVFGRFFPKFVPAIPLAFIMMSIFVPVAMLGVFNQAFAVLKAQRSLFFSVVLKTTVSMGLLAAFLPLFGIVGVAYEYVLTSVVSSVERYFAMKKRVPFELSALSKYDETDRLVLSSLKSVFSRLL